MLFPSPPPPENDERENFTQMFGPQHVDQFIRQAVHFCWVNLPSDHRTPEELDKQFRRMVERALKDFRDDREAFGR